MEIPSDQKWSAEILPTPGPTCDPTEGLYEEEGTLKVPLAGRARDRNGRALGMWQWLQVPGCSVWWRCCSLDVDWTSDVCGLETATLVWQLLRTQRFNLQLGQCSIRMDTAHSWQNNAKQGVAEIGCTFLNETLLKQNEILISSQVE